MGGYYQGYCCDRLLQQIGIKVTALNNRIIKSINLKRISDYNFRRDI